MNQLPKSQTDLRSRNLRMAVILASVAATFFMGFVAKMVMLPHH